MLENKKVKYGMRWVLFLGYPHYAVVLVVIICSGCVFFCRVTSSEKVDKENRYAEFCLCCIPYPGIVKSSVTYRAMPKKCTAITSVEL